MKVTSLERKLDKLGLKIEDKSEEKWSNYSQRDISMRYFEVVNNGKVLSWYLSDNEDEIDSVHICRVNDRPDMMTDYFPGWFPKTMKSAINALTEV